MSLRQLVPTCALALAMALAIWWLLWPDRAPVPQTPASIHHTTGDAQAEHAYLLPHGGPPGERRSGGTERTPPHAAKLHVRLRGLRADAPWTGELRLELSDRSGGRHGEHRAHGDVDTTGRCTLPLPTWWRPGMDIKLRVEGRSDGYRELHHRERGRLALADELVLDLQPVAQVTGSVRDSRGKAIACARVAAFATGDGQALDRLVGECGTADDGSFQLLAPPDQPLLLVACAMKPLLMRWRRIDGVRDNGEVDARYLPATMPMRLTMAAPPGEVVFTLADAARITGTVTRPDGSAVAHAVVSFDADDGTASAWTPQTKLRIAGQIAFVSGTVHSDAHGHYAIPAPPNIPMDVRVAALAATPLIGELGPQRARAPQQLDLTVPCTTTVRAVHTGEVVPFARILFDGSDELRSDGGGELPVVVAQPTHVRADRGALRSPRYAIEPARMPTVRDLEMSATLVEVAIDLVGDFPVRAAVCHWQRADGLQGDARLLRADSGSPFRLWLEPGHYRLRVTAAGSEPASAFLLPTEHTIDVDRKRVECALPARFGGTFSLEVLDDEGHRLGGRCSLTGPDGTRRVAEMAPGAAPGVFPAGALARCGELLPPGQYQLEVELADRRTLRRTIAIRPCEITPVVLRL